MTDSTSLPDLPLRLAPEVTAIVRGNRLLLRATGTALDVPSRLLPLLDAFRTPLTFREAMARFAAASKLEWMETSNAILQMRRAGVLVGEWPSLRAVEAGFGSAKIHVKMLNDEVRTHAFLQAIRRQVRPDDVVVDLGTGTGVLALAAAKAGARHVYAIEETGMANAAQALFEANDVADRITLLRGHSTAVSLPERADLLVSEIIGNDPFGEQVLAYTRDAIKRFLKDDARLIPSAVKLMARGISLSSEVLEKHLFEAQSTRRWSAAYGIDFSPLTEQRPDQPFTIRLPEHSFDAMSAPAELAEVDLRAPAERVEVEHMLPIERSGELDAVATWFEIPEMGVGSNPWEPGRARSWDNLAWLLPRPVAVEAGQPLPIRYHFAGLSLSLTVG